MIRIESKTLEAAYSQAAETLACSVTQLHVEIIQHPSSGFLGLFTKSAIIVAVRKNEPNAEVAPIEKSAKFKEEIAEVYEKPVSKAAEEEPVIPLRRILNDTILPESFVTDQDEEDEQNDYIEDAIEGMFDDEDEERFDNMEEIALEVKEQINALFAQTCFDLNEIDVSVYDDNTLMMDFNGPDAALLIGKEGYRYKALSYMIFNWLNAKYG
ncbi:Jag N-terminal domain-containing protein, partial [bacterium]|nr:Jag N-terminal domain-containing protein [bacterium]